MRILITSRNGANPYIKTLCSGISFIDKEIEEDQDVDAFWSNDVYQYDVVHVMWPEDMLFDKRGRHQEHSNQAFKNRFQSIKERGVKIISTCHDTQPHHWQGEPQSRYEEKKEAYDTVYKYSDVIIHLGIVSQYEFRKKYPQATQILIPHQVYDDRCVVDERKLNFLKGCSSGCNQYKIICIGQVRNSDELKLINDLAQACRELPVTINVPSMYAAKRVLFSFKGMLNLLRSGYYRMRYGNLAFGFRHFLSDKEISDYCNGSHIGFIQRLKINNSGNLPLNMLFGNVVVGPDDGNVGYWLKETGNVLFDAKKKPIELKSAVEKAIQYVKEGKGKTNRAYALEKWNTRTIAQMHVEAYRNILKKK